MKELIKVRKEFQDKRGEIYKKHGLFFAITDEDFNKEAAKASLKRTDYYALFGSGFIPKKNVVEFNKELNKSFRDEDEIVTSPKFRDKLIAYELSNYECYCCGDISDALAVLEPKGITFEEVSKVYKQEYPKQDL
tara:strand:- start:519 stop:923 length:405 start_codon:yes stop_codon:yes gene_type:complete